MEQIGVDFGIKYGVKISKDAIRRIKDSDVQKYMGRGDAKRQRKAANEQLEEELYRWVVTARANKLTLTN